MCSRAFGRDLWVQQGGFSFCDSDIPRGLFSLLILIFLCNWVCNKILFQRERVGRCGAGLWCKNCVLSVLLFVFLWKPL